MVAILLKVLYFDVRVVCVYINSGRDISEDLRSRVTTCESKRCMTCAHMVVGDAFVSNVNGRTYNIKGNSRVLDCSSRNVLFLVGNVGYSILVKLAKHYGVD